MDQMGSAAIEIASQVQTTVEKVNTDFESRATGTCGRGSRRNRHTITLAFMRDATDAECPRPERAVC